MTNVADDWPSRIAVLGVGLLGGSVAAAMRRARPHVTVVGLARNSEKRQRLLDSRIVDLAFTSIEQACRDCDVVVVASPVDQIAEMVAAAALSSPGHCLITDVGSTKAAIVERVEADERASGKFVAAHPIAGSERSGYQHASENLFDGKPVVITPAARTDPKVLEKAHQFWAMTGGVTCEMPAADHDAHLAAISHVPHLVSALVARMAPPPALGLVGSGWRDITRVAAGDPGMWTAICQENRNSIAAELERLAGELETLRRLIQQQDDAGLVAWLSEAKQIKEQTTRTS